MFCWTDESVLRLDFNFGQMRVCREFTLMSKDKINVEYLWERKKFNMGFNYLLMTSVEGYVHKR